VAAQGISVLTVEPGAFRTNAYAGFANEPVTEPIPEYRDMLEQVRAAFVEMDGTQPGDTLEQTLADIRSDENLSRSADFPA